ncbi:MULTISPECIES: helix-turn-helix transcriptional regulator [unclassified Serratia (in: enterobacteria)]|uniref:helix-turn-helix domain-containing protein n=1 Tax=unclassified Serratia (in: enterobacteria) TaxID=2647522 RepID=UPI00117A8BC4|nr:MULTISPECIES: helix-turn-helix transcriptional regulator [unclassified Serratia (in: enterobacteria)]
MKSNSYDDKSADGPKIQERIFVESGIVHFGQRLKLAMEKAGGLTNVALAERTGMSEAVIRSYLKGKTYPTVDRLALLAYACDCSLEWLLVGHGEDKFVSHKSAIIADKHDGEPLAGNLGELLILMKRMTEQEREALLNIVFRKGIGLVLSLDNERNVSLLQLPDSVKEGVLKLASAPDTAIRESLSSLAENAHTASVANKKAV